MTIQGETVHTYVSMGDAYLKAALQHLIDEDNQEAGEQLARKLREQYPRKKATSEPVPVPMPHSVILKAAVGKE